MRRLDPWLLLSVLVLGAVAILVQQSTAQALAEPGFAGRQIAWLALGLALIVLFAFTDYRVLIRLAPLFYGTAVVVLAAMLVLAPVRAGTRAWLSIGPYTVQPSEFARVATLLAVAAMAGRLQRSRLAARHFVALAALVALPALLVVLEPDLGVALTYGPILIAALWLGGLPWRTWMGLALVGLVVIAAAWVWYLKPYQKERVLTFIDPNRAPYGAGYQQRQSTIAVGSGGLAGRGLGSGTQSQLRFLPAQHTDFIFAVWAEETGFLGAAVVLGAYILLIARVMLTGLAARDRSGAVLAGCTGAVLGAQVIVNIGMVTGLAPITGITLPLISYGGSSVLATCISIGLVLSVWRLRYANV